MHCPSEELRWQRLCAVLDQLPEPGIVYVPTRRAAEELAERLAATGVQARAYHGGMAAGERTRRHEDFLADRVPVMVATSAFGMGIDKPNIRFVVHAALPDSPDSYLQEVGRAGRDGAPAQAVLLHRGEDIALQRYFTGGAPDAAELERLATVLHAGPVNKTDLGRHTKLGPRKLGQLLSLLEQVGAARADAPRRVDGAPVRARAGRRGPARTGRGAAVPGRGPVAHRHDAPARRDHGCRTQLLLAYFGEQLRRHCGHCDNCLAGTASAAASGSRAGRSRCTAPSGTPSGARAWCCATKVTGWWCSSTTWAIRRCLSRSSGAGPPGARIADKIAGQPGNMPTTTARPFGLRRIGGMVDGPRVIHWL